MPITAVMSMAPKACAIEALISMYNDHNITIELPKAFHDLELQKNLYISRGNSCIFS